MTMRVVHVVINPSGGGAERVATLICQELARRGHEAVLAPIDPDPAGAPDVVATWSLSSHRMPTPRRELLAAHRLRKLLDRAPADVVHLHCEAPEVVGALALVGRSADRVIVSEHTGQPWKGRWAPVERPVRAYLARRGATWVRCAAGAGGHRHGDDVPVIPNPLRSVGAAIGASRRPLSRLLLIGRLLRSKGTEHVLRAAAEAGFTGTAVIIGNGPERERLEELCEALPLSVEFRGMRENPWEDLRDGDLFVSASEYEGEPLTVLEAMSLNAPMLLSAIPGHRSTIQRPEQAFATPSELERRLAELCTGSLSLSTLQPGAEASARVRTERSPERITEAWLDVYRDVQRAAA